MTRAFYDSSRHYSQMVNLDLLMKRTICVFGNSSPEPGSTDYEEARTLGGLLARAGYAVCSGGYYGVMEAVSRGAVEAGGHTVGMTTPFYKLSPNPYVMEEVPVPRWQDRLFAMIERGDGYVVMKGGTGTLLELAALWESLNKRAIECRPCAAMEFWAPVLECVRVVERDRRGRTWHEFGASLIEVAASPEHALEILVQGLKKNPRPMAATSIDNE